MFCHNNFHITNILVLWQQKRSALEEGNLLDARVSVLDDDIDDMETSDEEDIIVSTAVLHWNRIRHKNSSLKTYMYLCAQKTSSLKWLKPISCLTKNVLVTGSLHLFLVCLFLDEKSQGIQMWSLRRWPLALISVLVPCMFRCVMCFVSIQYNYYL